MLLELHLLPLPHPEGCAWVSESGHAAGSFELARSGKSVWCRSQVYPVSFPLIVVAPAIRAHRTGQALCTEKFPAFSAVV